MNAVDEDGRPLPGPSEDSVAWLFAIQFTPPNRDDVLEFLAPGTQLDGVVAAEVRELAQWLLAHADKPVNRNHAVQGRFESSGRDRDGRISPTQRASLHMRLNTELAGARITGGQAAVDEVLTFLQEQAIRRGFPRKEDERKAG